MRYFESFRAFQLGQTRIRKFVFADKARASGYALLLFLLYLITFCLGDLLVCRSIIEGLPQFQIVHKYQYMDHAQICDNLHLHIINMPHSFYASMMRLG